MSKTRLKALMNQIDSGQMKTDAARVLNYIINNGMTSRPMIGDALNMPEKTVSARVSGLLDMGVIVVLDPETYNELPIEKPEYEILAYVKEPLAQVKNAYNRKKAKFNAWKKRGLNEFGEFLNEDQLVLQLE